MLAILIDALFVSAGLFGLGVLAAYAKPLVASFRQLQAQANATVTMRSVRVRILVSSVGPGVAAPDCAAIYRPQFGTKTEWLPFQHGQHPFLPGLSEAA